MWHVPGAVCDSVTPVWGQESLLLGQCSPAPAGEEQQEHVQAVLQQLPSFLLASGYKSRFWPNVTWAPTERLLGFFFFFFWSNIAINVNWDTWPRSSWFLMSSSHWQEVLREALLPVECAANLGWWGRLAGQALCQAYLVSLPMEMRNGSVLLLSPLPLKKSRLMWVYNHCTKVFPLLSLVGR